MNICDLKQQIQIKDIAEHLLGRPVRGMYRYPGEKTPSVKIYPETRSFYDFGRAFGGDSLDLWMHVRQCDLPEALHEIKDLYGIEDDSAPDRAWIEKKRKAQEIARQEKARKQRIWREEVERLQEQIRVCNTLLESAHVPPMSDVWGWCIEIRQMAEYKLNILCNVE